MSNLTNVVGQEEFNKVVAASELPVLVDFWAPWCGPCQMMAPVLEALSAKFNGKLKIVKIDTDVPENQRLAIDYQIQSIPNLKVFKGGLVVKDYVGYRDENQFSAELSSLLS